MDFLMIFLAIGFLETIWMWSASRKKSPTVIYPFWYRPLRFLLMAIIFLPACERCAFHLAFFSSSVSGLVSTLFPFTRPSMKRRTSAASSTATAIRKDSSEGKRSKAIRRQGRKIIAIGFLETIWMWSASRKKSPTVIYPVWYRPLRFLLMAIIFLPASY